jgi:hypothetical protein
MSRLTSIAIPSALVAALALAACNQAAPPADNAAATPAATAAAPASADTPQVIYDRHVANMNAGNLEGVMADYADDAVVVAPAGIAGQDGVFVGKENVRKLFAVLTAGKSPDGPAMEETSKPLDDQAILMRWGQNLNTPQAVTGTDVYVVRNGKIVFQTVTPDAKPTWP